VEEIIVRGCSAFNMIVPFWDGGLTVVPPFRLLEQCFELRLLLATSKDLLRSLAEKVPVYLFFF
jgi:hypothetical protein